MQLFRKVTLAMLSLLLASAATVSDAKPLKSNKLAALAQRGKQLVAGVGVAAMLCTSAGCATKRVIDKKYDKVLPTVAATSFVTSVALGFLAAEEKVSPVVSWIPLAAYTATFFYSGMIEYDYGEERWHSRRGGVDWYGMPNDLYSEHRVYGIRLEGQEQFAAHQHDLEPYNYNRVLVHIRHNGRDYAAVVKEPRRRRPLMGAAPLQFRIRIPSRHPSKPTLTIVDSLQQLDTYSIFLDAVQGVYLTNHPDYERDEWVVIAEEEKLLYGKIVHHFSSEYAQVKILAVEEDNNFTMLPEDSDTYRVYPQDALQREEDLDELK